jgi:hypothetical protein
VLQSLVTSALVDGGGGVAHSARTFDVMRDVTLSKRERFHFKKKKRTILRYAFPVNVIIEEERARIKIEIII